MTATKRRRAAWAWLAVCVLLSVLAFVFLDFVLTLLGEPEPEGVSDEVDLSVFAVLIGVWSALPAFLAAVAFGQRAIGALPAGLVAALAPGGVLAGALVFVSDSRSDDPSSTAGLIFIALPFWMSLLSAVAILLAVGVGRIRAKR